MGRSKYNRQTADDGTPLSKVLGFGTGGWKGSELLDDGHEITAEEWDFMAAMERHKKVNRIRFPTYRDVLTVVKSLGYVRKTPATGTGKV